MQMDKPVPEHSCRPGGAMTSTLVRAGIAVAIHRTLPGFLLALAAAASISTTVAQSGPIVAVTGGQIRGRTLQSGAVFKGIPFAKKMGAPATGALAYMRKLPVEAVLKAEPTYGTGGIGPNADGYVIKDVSAKTFAAGEEKQVPLMIGSTARERSLDGGGLPTWPRFDVKTRRYLEFTDNGPVAKENLRGEACALFIDFLKQKIARQ
jgi:hypothetical protein